MTDLTSRQAVVNVVRQICENCGKYKEYNGVMCGTCALDGVEDSIEELPPVEAIPVDWIEKFMESPIGGSSIEDMLGEWKYKCEIEGEDG